MRKINFLIILLTLTLLIISIYTFGHTINQHLEELYGDAYLPLFIIASWLPFIGLGMLAYSPAAKKLGIQVNWYFLVSLIFGLIIGFYATRSELSLFVNRIAILASGFLLLFTKKSFGSQINILFMLTGITLGLENSAYIFHAREFMWLFILIFLTGIFIFLILNNIQFIGHPKRKIIRYVASLFLLLSGLILILLA